MLIDHDSSAIVAVADLERARSFYEETLGLEPLDATDEVLTFRTGATKLVVYRSAMAGSNRANAVVWGVGDDLDAIVAKLETRGVVFEHYADIGQLDGNVHVVDGARLVWLKDPDGNILHLNNF